MVKDLVLVATIIALVCSLVTTTRQRNQARALNVHRGTFDSLELLHYKIRDDNNLRFSYDAELLYKVRGEIFALDVIATKWTLDGSHELVLTYEEGGQKRLLRERENKSKKVQGCP